MKAILRFALHALLPPLGGGTVIVGAALISSFGRIPPVEISRGVLLVMVGAYLVAAIPSVIYAAVMEFAARRGVKPGSRRALVLSAGLGGIVGASLVVVAGGGKDWPLLIALSALGLFVGLAVEWLIGQIEQDTPQRVSLCDQGM